MAPSVVGESLKGAELVAEVMQNQLGMPCNPPPGSHRTDIIQAVQCGTRKKVVLILFFISIILHPHFRRLYSTHYHY
jgi:cystathionine beta-lyase family protein involved in aluminum resistance